MGKKIHFKNLDKEVKKILEEYEGFVSEGVCDEAYATAAEEAVNRLSATAPRMTGDYARSWDYKKEFWKKGKSLWRVYATAPEYRLTHLLEKGHAKVNGGRVAANPHIRPVEEAIGDTVVRKIKEGLS